MINKRCLTPFFCGKYDDLYTLKERGLIDDELLYNSFSDDFSRFFKNEEVGAYLKKIRQDGINYFSGIEELHTAMIEHEEKLEEQ